VSFQFPVLEFIELSDPQPQNLIELANLQQILNPQTLPKIESVLSHIREDRSDQVTDIEWIYCIHAKAEWDKKYSDQAIESSQIFWKTAQNNSTLRCRLLWHLSLYYSGQNRKFALSFVESFSFFSDTDKKELIFLSQIIYALSSDEPYNSIAQISHKYKITKQELNSKLEDHIPTFVPAINQVSDYIVPYFSKLIHANEADIIWLIKCLQEMPISTQAIAVSHLLENFNVEVISNYPVLVTWLQENYDFRKAVEKWNKLSDKAKVLLRKWIGAISYGDFQKWVNKLLNRLSLQRFESNRLIKRSEFWSNYSDRFERIRILIPQCSLQALAQEKIQNDDILIQDNSDETEICIFDFGEYLVVEFFRGLGGETRIFIKTNKLENLFFGSSKLSTKQIRCQGGHAHDHEYLWQVYCERLLREKYNIRPNLGIQYFQGGRVGQNRYDPIRGLQEPSQREQQERQRKLERWHRDFERIEREAKAYCADKQL
jgi:hypothetical protein